MVRTIVCKQSLLSSLKKQAINPSPSLKSQSNGLKRQSDSPASSSVVLKEEMIKVECEEEDDCLEFVPRCSKRKRNLLFGKPEMRQIMKKGNRATRKSAKHTGQSNTSRWSAARYEQAEENMLAIMKKEGAIFGNPISRTSLRTAARKFIGDTGLLDHLLKHMDGKVAPGGAERFRRWHNSKGQMEYWLESADLFDIRMEAGIQDPFWMPLPGWKPGCSPSESSGYAVELKILREEMDKMKRDFQELVLKKADEDLANHTPNSSVSNHGVSDSGLSSMQSELANWREKIKKQLYEISGTLGSVQDACVNLEKWKGKIEQKLLDMSISVSTMQTSRHSNTFNQSEPDNWDFFSNHDLVGTQPYDLTSWLGSSELIDIQQTDYNGASWMEGLDFVKIEPDMSTLEPDPVSAPVSNPDHFSYNDHTNHNDLEAVKDEMSKMKRNIHDVLLRKDDGGHANATSDSSVTDNSKLDLENSILMLQELYKDVVRIKADIERQVKDVSVSLHGSEDSQLDVPRI